MKNNNLARLIQLNTAGEQLETMLKAMPEIVADAETLPLFKSKLDDLESKITALKSGINSNGQ